jgi:hypothetical protein
LLAHSLFYSRGNENIARMEIKEIDGQQKSQENIFGVEITIKDVI